MAVLRGANLGLAFVLELAMLFALVLWAQNLAGVDMLARWALSALLVATAMMAWSKWAAPRSCQRLSGPALLVFKLTMFSIAALALHAAGASRWAVVFAVLAAANLALEQVEQHH